MKLILFVLLFCSNISAVADEILPNVSIVNSTPMQPQLGQVVMMLILTVLLIVAVIWIIKKSGYGGNPQANKMAIKACLSLSSKEKLYVIEVAGEQLLIGAGSGHICLLKELPQPITDNTKTHNVNSAFSKKLQNILNPNAFLRAQDDSVKNTNTVANKKSDREKKEEQLLNKFSDSPTVVVN